MDITPLIAEGSQIIQGYGSGGFKINGESIKGNLIVLPTQVFAWNIIDINAIDLLSLAPLIQHKNHVDILLVGCGKRPIILPITLKESLKQHGISVDTMDTGAACRTYNVLLSEGRNVATAVIAVE